MNQDSALKRFLVRHLNNEIAVPRDVIHRADPADHLITSCEIASLIFLLIGINHGIFPNNPELFKHQ
jgi:hypothetical protein